MLHVSFMCYMYMYITRLIITRLKGLPNMYNYFVASCVLKKEQQLCNIDDVENSPFFYF